MLIHYIMGKLVLAAFMLWSAYDDYKHRSIDLRPCFIMWGLGIVGYGYLFISAKNPDLASALLGILPGIGMLGLSVLTRSSLGSGDGFYFIALGIFMGIRTVSLVLFLVFLLLAGVSLLWIVYSAFVGKSSYKKSLPMLPFVLPIGLYILIYYD